MDNLPNGMVPSIVTLSGPGCTGSLTFTSSSAILEDGVVPASTSCFYVVAFKASVTGATSNAVTVNSVNAASTTSASVELFVIPPPFVQMVYRASKGGEIDAKMLVSEFVGEAFLEITVQNTNTFEMTGVRFSHVLPTELTALSVSTEESGCVDAIHTTTTITLSNGNVPPLRSCVYVIRVSIVAEGSAINNVEVQTDNAGKGISNR